MKTTPSLVMLALGIASAWSQEEVRKAPPNAAGAKAESMAQATSPAETQLKVGPVTVVTKVMPSGKNETTRLSPYLGVVTGQVSPAVRAQVGLQEGMGLTVEAIAKGSPAEKAGIKQYDILKKFNDQMLCNSDQLAALVGAAGKGTTASLAVIRGGVEKNVPVTLGEHAVALPDVKIGGTWSSVDGPKIDIQIDKLAEALKPLGANAQDFTQQLQDQIFKQRKEVEEQVQNLTQKADEAAKRARELAERSGKPQARVYSFRPNASSQSTIVIKDADGEIQIRETNGSSTVQIRGNDGKEIYSGPLNEEKDFDAVPEKFRDKVHKAAKDMKKTHAKPEAKVESKGESI